VEFDVALRSIGGISVGDVPSYTALDARLGWMITKNIAVSLSGFNLLDRKHPEFGNATTRSEFKRNVYLEMSWRF